jgi:hypothetical protein
MAKTLLVMRSTIILVLAAIRALGERRSGLICPISKLYATVTEDAGAVWRLSAVGRKTSLRS